MASVKVKVYGASDDLIEVEGPKWGDEFAGGDKPKWLHFSDGTVLKIWYGDDGIWKVEIDTIGKGTLCDKKVCLKETAEGYSDVVTLTGDIKSVTLCSSPLGETLRDVQDWLDEWHNREDFSSLNLTQLQAIKRAIQTKGTT